ncbi:MAG TPA: DUF4852 domain-containing protein, partial [Alphaproteobacteria bacterium]|nr:DUF4852 domain-containing protein [Alphaproteobacteria bacterium]
KEYPVLNYVNVTQALLHLDRFKTDNDDYLDAYAMAAHCDVVAGSYGDEFRWKQAREALKRYIATRKAKLPTRLAVRGQIMFTRYDFDTKYVLFAPETQLKKVNTFITDNRPSKPACNASQARLLPLTYMVVTNNPITLPGLHLTEEEARDLAQKFGFQKNRHRVAYIRFLIDVLDSDYIGPSVFASRPTSSDRLKVKGTLHAIEFFSDANYQNRFYIYYPY